MKILITLLISLNIYALVSGVIYDVRQLKEISVEDFSSSLALADIIVMGEKHYTKEVQIIESQIIKNVVNYKRQFQETSFILGWEFLNATDEIKTQGLFEDLREGRISTEDFLLATGGNPNSRLYAPMLNEVLELEGELIGVNLSRLEKAPVVKDGLKALDPKLLPPDFNEGGENYFERFFDVMKDHASMGQIKNYFTAQSLVDDVSAYHLTNTNFDLKFLVIGAFHSMFNDGVVSRLKIRNPSKIIMNVEIIDKNDILDSSIEKILYSQKYGNRADFVIFTEN